MPDWLMKAPWRREFHTGERCFITEILNDPACPEMSLARARVEAGVTTRLHALIGTVEVYVIEEGRGLVEIGGESAEVGPGDRVVIPAGVTQRIANIGAGELLFLCLCQPRFLPENYVDLGDG